MNAIVWNQPKPGIQLTLWQVDPRLVFRLAHHRLREISASLPKDFFNENGATCPFVNAAGEMSPGDDLDRLSREIGRQPAVDAVGSVFPEKYIQRSTW